MTTPDWEQRYRDDDKPWDSGRPDKNLPHIVESYGIKPGQALELGCGTGSNALWLAQNGFTVTAVDVSSTAIEQAKSRAGDIGAGCSFATLDLLREEDHGLLAQDAYDFVFDRGCFHSFEDLNQRHSIAKRIAHTLRPGGLWLSLMGSADGPPRENGPPARSALYVVEALEPHFELQLLKAGWLDSNRETQATAWIVLVKPRLPSTESKRA